MTVVLTMAFILITIPSAWAGMMGVTTTIPGGGSNTTTTINGGGMTGGGGYDGWSGMMNQFKAADLNGDGVPEIIIHCPLYLAHS